MAGNGRGTAAFHRIWREKTAASRMPRIEEIDARGQRRAPLPEFDELHFAEEPQPSSAGWRAFCRRAAFAAAIIVSFLLLLLLLRGSSNEKAPPGASDASSAPSPTAAAPSFLWSLLQNPMVFMPLCGFIIGTLSAIAYKLFNYVYQYHIASHINIKPSLTITSKDPNFTIVKEYLAKRCLSSLNQRALEASTVKDGPKSLKSALKSRWFGVEDEKTAPQRFSFQPTSGKYSMVGNTATSFKYRPYTPKTLDPKTGKNWDQSEPADVDQDSQPEDLNNDFQSTQPWWARLLVRFWIKRSGEVPVIDLVIDERDINPGSGSGPNVLQYLTLSLWGYDTQPLKQIVNDALLWHFENERQNSDLKIFVLSENRWLEEWSLATSRRKRSKDSVLFDDDENGHNILRELIEDAQNFFSEHTVQTYADKGMPHRRGYLLYGPPGCGKTSFITVLAGELNKDVCILNLNDDLSDNSLASALRSAPLASIIALEDVDAIFTALDSNGQKVKDKRQMKSSKLSFSGLLNALDGVASQEGRILIMTTNHREKLDPALIRPGRVDVEKEIRNASRKQIEGMFLRFYGNQPYPEALINHAKNFAAKLPEYEISMAKLQGFFQAAAKRITDANGEQSDLFSVMPDKCVEKASELMKQGDQDPSMSVFEHFWRLGLEKYAPHFERQCVCNVMQFKNCDIDTIVTSCIELELDAAALSTLKKLQKEDADLVSSSYAEADTSTIRDLFFAAFPSTDAHGNITVYSRFKRAAKVRNNTGRYKGADSPMESPLSGHSSYLGSDDTMSTGSRDNRSLLEIGTSVQSIIKGPESQRNTPLLFHTSIFRMKQLFELYQNRPYDCEAMLKKFAIGPEETICQFSARQSCEYIAQELDLASFLKRLCISPAILTVLHSMLICDVKSFMDFCSSSSVHVLCARFCLQIDQAKRLLDFCSKDEKKSALFRRKFLLPSKQDIKTYFTAYYTSSNIQVDELILEQYAVEFSDYLCDSVRKCTSVVSFFEIEEYLSALSPAAARSEHALSILKAPVQIFEKSENPFATVYNHLFRVGLQHYAPAFVQCGVNSIARFRAIDIDCVAENCPLLSLDLFAQAELKLLGQENEQYILENYASASRQQVTNLLHSTGADDDTAARLLKCNISLYHLKNMTHNLPAFDQISKACFDDSISSLLQPCSMHEQQNQQLTFVSIVRRLSFPLIAAYQFSENFSSVQKFVKDARDGVIDGLSQSFGSALPDRQLRRQLDDFCSSKTSSNYVTRLKFIYPSTGELAQTFVSFFNQFGNAAALDLKCHAFHFSRILSGWQSGCHLFPFRGSSYFSLFEVEAFLTNDFLSFAKNEAHLTIHTTIELCRKLIEFRRSEEYLKEPDPPKPPSPLPKSDLQIWLENVFLKDARAAAAVNKKFSNQAIHRLGDLNFIDELPVDVLQSKFDLKVGEAWKVHLAFNSLKSMKAE